MENFKGLRSKGFATGLRLMLWN